MREHARVADPPAEMPRPEAVPGGRSGRRHEARGPLRDSAGRRRRGHRHRRRLFHALGPHPGHGRSPTPGGAAGRREQAARSRSLRRDPDDRVARSSRASSATSASGRERTFRRTSSWEPSRAPRSACSSRTCIDKGRDPSGSTLPPLRAESEEDLAFEASSDWSARGQRGDFPRGRLLEEARHSDELPQSFARAASP